MKLNDDRDNANGHNLVINPNWWEFDQLAIFKHDLGAGLGSTKKQLQLSSQRGT